MPLAVPAVVPGESPTARLLAGLGELQRRSEEDPLAYMRWLPGQDAFLRNPGKRVLFRAGNQAQGKTWALLAELVYRCLGRHPHKPVPKPPITAYLVTASWQQSLEIQRKLWRLLPKNEIDPETVFDEARGFRGKNPAIKFRNGSLLRIKTSLQGGLAQSGGTIHVIGIDEPVSSPRVFSELERRLTRTGGVLLMAMTPVNADCTFLRKMVEEGKITDLHFPLTAENLIPVGAAEPMRTEDHRLMDGAWIEEQRNSVLAFEAPVIIDGEWEFKSVDRVFSAFRDDVHAVPDLMSSPVAPTGDLQVCLGLDWGEDKLRTAGVLTYVDESGEYPKLYVVAEYAPEVATTVDMDAAGILTMLAARGDRWPDLDYAWADKRYQGRESAKNARNFMEAIEKLTGVSEARPKVRVAKRGSGAGAGSLWRSVRWIHDCMVRPGHFFVDASCTHLIEALHNWDGTERHPGKDILDGLRYSVRHHWDRRDLAQGRILRRAF